jgi:hypothetical protein
MSEAASVAGCASSVDSDCTCPSTAFKDTLGSCLKFACTPDDITGMSTSALLAWMLHTRVLRLILIFSSSLVAGELHKERCGTAPSE